MTISTKFGVHKVSQNMSIEFEGKTYYLQLNGSLKDTIKNLEKEIEKA